MAPVCLSSSIIGNSAFGKSSNTNFSCSHPSVFMSPWENIFLLSQSFFDVAEHLKKKKKGTLAHMEEAYFFCHRRQNWRVS